MRRLRQLIPNSFILFSMLQQIANTPHRPLLAFFSVHVNVEVPTAKRRYRIDPALAVTLKKYAPAFSAFLAFLEPGSDGSHPLLNSIA